MELKLQTIKLETFILVTIIKDMQKLQKKENIY